MPARHKFSTQQIEELEQAYKSPKSKLAEKRICAVLLEACGRNIPVLQAAVDFYEMMGCGKTIYLAYTLMLLAQSNAQLGDTLTAFKQYSRALTVFCEVVSELPAEPSDNFQSLYRAEVFQLASDICAAVASGDSIHFYPELLWQNFRTLISLTQKQAECCVTEDDVKSYAGTWLTLRIFSGQVSGYTQRAFVLRMSAPACLPRNPGSFPDIFGFFLPTETESNTPADTSDGFDVFSRDKLAVRLNSPWNTLAFPENVRTGDDMLKELLTVDASGLNTFGKRSLYGMICALAKRLEREDVVAQYKNGLLALPQE